MASDEVELKPCPCGQPAVRDDTGNKSPESIVRCSVCTFAAFITDWNARAPSTGDAVSACRWKKARPPFCDWTTECGNAFDFEELDGPKDMNMKFCMFCGKEIK